MKNRLKWIVICVFSVCVISVASIPRNAYAAGISISASRDDVYDQLLAAANINVVANTMRKCAASIWDRDDSFWWGGAIDASELSSADIFTGETDISTALWVENRVQGNGGDDGAIWCKQSYNGTNILNLLAQVTDTSISDWVCRKDGTSGLLHRATTSGYTFGYGITSNDTDCKSFNDDGAMWIATSENDDTMRDIFDEIYDDWWEEASKDNPYIPSSTELGSFDNVDGYITYMRDFDTFCSADILDADELSGRSYTAITEYDVESETKITSQVIYYHANDADKDWTYPLAKYDETLGTGGVLTCGGLLDGVARLENSFNQISRNNRSGGYSGNILTTLSDACAGATTAEGDLGWDELEKQLQDIVDDPDATQDAKDDAQANLAKVDEISSRSPYAYVDVIEESDDKTIYQCAEIDGLTIDVNDYDTPAVDVPIDDPATTEEQTCMGAGQAGSLGWIVCPILEWATDTIDDLYSDAVEPALQVKPQLFNESGDGAKTKEAWGTFQTIANTVFIILFLVVIFSQLTGIGIDNYGIKRILPKMIVVAILVNLSYHICVIAVDLSNIIGNGLQSMFNGMADAIGATTINAGDTGVGGAGVIAAVSIIAVVMVLAIIANPAILLTFFVTVLGALISVFFLFVLLSARQAAILILTVISPLAFVSYMLPNTKKSFFDKWLKLGQGLLLVYPIAGLLVSGGNYASTLLFYVGGETTNLFSAITAVIVGVAPIFFIPTVLKSAFSAMGTLGAKISGLGAGMRGRFDRAARNSEAYRGLQQRGQERRMRVRAGLNKDGTVATGRFARFMSAGPGRNRRRAAASAMIDKNYATDRYGDAGFLEAKAASRQIAQENAEVKEQEALISNSRDAHGGSIIDDTAEMQRRYQNALLGLDERGNRVGINESKIRAYQNLLTAKGDDGRQAVHRAVRDAEQHGASTEALRIHASNLIGSHGGDYKANSRSTFDHANGILNGKTASMSTYENDHAKLVGSIKPETLGAMDDDEFGRLISNAGATAASQQALADAAYEASQNESAMANVKKSRKDQIMALAASSAQQAANEARESQLASQQEQVFRVQQEQIAQVAGPATRAINYGNGVGGSTITIDVGEFAMPSSFETSKVSSTYVTAKDGAKHHLLSHDGKIWDATAGEYIKMNKFKNT